MSTLYSVMNQTELPYYYGAGQLPLELKGFDQSVQGSLDLGVKSRRGNPKFMPKWKTKTKAVRIPDRYVDQVLEICREWENDGWIPEGLEGENIFDTVTLINTPVENLVEFPTRSDLPIRSPQGIHDFLVSELELDPKRFQYKIIHGKTGSTGSLNSVQIWNNVLAGIRYKSTKRKKNRVYKLGEGSRG